MDSMKSPMREIKKKYTKSELMLMAWDSKQKSHAMHIRFKTPSNIQKVTEEDEFVNTRNHHNNGVVEMEDRYVLPDGVNAGVAIPKHFFDDNGEVNLTKVKGHEAVRYLNALGLNIVPAIRL